MGKYVIVCVQGNQRIKTEFCRETLEEAQQVADRLNTRSPKSVHYEVEGVE